MSETYDVFYSPALSRFHFIDTIFCERRQTIKIDMNKSICRIVD